MYLLQYFQSSYQELKKVSFPSRKETFSASVEILILIFALAMFLGLVDMVVGNMISVIIASKFF